MIWQPGQKLRNGTYEIDRELGRGGFGITYLARHIVLECPMVIKSPHTHLSSEPTYTAYVDRFTKEGRNLKDLSKAQHPNIVRVADFFDEGAVPCMVMDYVEGETLSDRVQQSGAIDEAIIVPCIVTIAEVLAKVHELNLVHRDANPANIAAAKRIRTSGKMIGWNRGKKKWQNHTVPILGKKSSQQSR